MPLVYNTPNYVFGATPESIAGQEFQMMDQNRLYQAQALQAQQAQQQQEQARQQMMADMAYRAANLQEQARQSDAQTFLGMQRIKEEAASRALNEKMRKDALWINQSKLDDAEQRDLKKNIEQSIIDSESPVDIKQLVNTFPQLDKTYWQTIAPLVDRKNRMYQDEQGRLQSAVNLLSMPISLKNQINALSAQQLDAGTDDKKRIQATIDSLTTQLEAAKTAVKSIPKQTMDRIAFGPDLTPYIIGSQPTQAKQTSDPRRAAALELQAMAQQYKSTRGSNPDAQSMALWQQQVMQKYGLTNAGP